MRPPGGFVAAHIYAYNLIRGVMDRSGDSKGSGGTPVTAMAGTPYFFEDIHLGMEASYTRIVTEADITSFAEVSGDRNPIHIDAGYAATTMFKERIAHGILTASYISAVFGMQLPGPGAIYISQTLNFKAPVRIGDEVITTVKVAEVFPAKRRIMFHCVCAIGGKPVLEGEAMLMVPGRPK